MITSKREDNVLIDNTACFDKLLYCCKRYKKWQDKLENKMEKAK